MPLPRNKRFLKKSKPAKSSAHPKGPASSGATFTDTSSSPPVSWDSLPPIADGTIFTKDHVEAGKALMTKVVEGIVREKLGPDATPEQIALLVEIGMSNEVMGALADSVGISDMFDLVQPDENMAGPSNMIGIVRNRTAPGAADSRNNRS